MEEDIDKLEELLKEFEVYGDLDGIQDLKPYMKALEHLIKAYKRKDVSYNTAYNLGKAFENNKWTSKIKEKIEENKGYLEYSNTAYEYTQKEVIEENIKTLEELLEVKANDR